MSKFLSCSVDAALKNGRCASTARIFRRTFILLSVSAASLTLLTSANAAQAMTASQTDTAMSTKESGDQNDKITTHIVEIKQFKFSPATLTVKKGDKITWKNLDVVPHTATAKDKAWDSGSLKKNDEWSLIVKEVGEKDYICTFHPVMKGKLIITE